MIKNIHTVIPVVSSFAILSPLPPGVDFIRNIYIYIYLFFLGGGEELFIHSLHKMATAPISDNSKSV